MSSTGNRAPLLVVVTGAPATGKTTVAERLERELGLLRISRDDFKETLFDTLGWSDRAWSRRLGGASWELLFIVLERALRTGTSIIVESNFRDDPDTERFRCLLREVPAAVVQIYCSTAPNVLLERFASRQRHAGHVDHEVLAEVAAGLSGDAWAPLTLPGVLLRVDTTRLDGKRLEGVLSRVREAMSGR